MNKKIEEIINRHLVFNRYGVLMSDDIDVECLVDNLHRLFDVEIERLEKKTEKLQYVCDCTEEVLDLISENPYCKEIFPEPTKEQYALFHSILQKHGLTLDRFSGAVSRKAWDGFKALVNNKLQQALKEAKK